MTVFHFDHPISASGQMLVVCCDNTRLVSGSGEVPNQCVKLCTCAPRRDCQKVRRPEQQRVVPPMPAQQQRAALLRQRVRKANVQAALPDRHHRAAFVRDISRFIVRITGNHQGASSRFQAR